MEGASDAALLDGRVLQTPREFRVPGEPDPAGEVVRMFLEVTPARLERLRQAAQQAESAEVRRIAHQVRGSCSTVGAVAMYAVADRLEALEIPAEVLPLVITLAECFAQTRPLLETFAREAELA